MVLTRKRRAIEAQNAVASASGTPNGRSLEGELGSALRAQHSDALLALPFDILLEILNQVKPRDLLNLSRLNKAWRATMRGGNVNSRAVWTVKRRESRIPEPPAGVTEPQWASLWFETFCQSCCICRGSIDWVLFKRVCGECKSKHFVSRSQYKKRPGQFEEYLDYVPSVRRGNTDNYWDEDVQKVVRLFSQLDPSSLTAWKSKRLAALQERTASQNQIKRAYDAWKAEAKRVENAERVQRRIEENMRTFERSKAVFRDMGYEDVDIGPVMTTDNPRVAIYLKSASYLVYFVSDFRRQFEGSIQRQRDTRVMREMEPLMDERMKVFQNWYYSEALPKVFRPITQILCPQPEEFRRQAHLQTMLERNREVPMKIEDLVINILPKLRNWIQSHWEMNIKFESLVCLLPNVDSKPNDIYLARHVFQRCQHSAIPPAADAILIGWRMVASHRCTQCVREVRTHRGLVSVKMPCRFSYNLVASRTAGRLISLAGLQIGSATVEDMDARDARFVVTSRTTGRTEAAEYPILSWKGAIATMYILQSEECRLATEEEEKMAKENEPALRETVRAWACDHCNKFLEPTEAQTKPSMVQHLKEEHDILEPQLMEDFFVNDRCRHMYEAASYVFKRQ